MKLFLGIDGGQSSTTALIGDEEGQVIGWARGGPCNHVAASEASQRFRSVVSSSVREACQSAGLNVERQRFTAACCGMSGGPEDKTALLRSLIDADYLAVVTDGEIALAGAMNGEDGIVVSAGTGSIAFGRRAAKLVRAGGWGYVFGDEGSAFDIARQAVRAALRFEEGWGPVTALHEALLDMTEARDANQMMHLFYQPDWPRSRVAAMSALVDSVAIDGDSVAREILDQAARVLAALAAVVRAQLFREGADVRISPIGGVFRSHLLKTRFRVLVEFQGRSRCVDPALDSAAGALLESYRLIGRKPALSNLPKLK